MIDITDITLLATPFTLSVEESGGERATSATATKLGSGAATATQINQYDASAERKF